MMRVARCDLVRTWPMKNGERRRTAMPVPESMGAESSMLKAALPESMRAVAITQPGGPEVLQLVQEPVPVPVAGEVLIEVVAAGVNRPDVAQRQGTYPPPPGASPLPGLEVSGTIVAVGEGVPREVLGEKVCALVQGGGYADYVVTPYAQCFPVPPGLSFEDAAALPETLMTVWHNLFERAYVAEGDSVLIHGGTSGIGTTAITLCRLFGITSIVTCGSGEKCRAATEWGRAMRSTIARPTLSKR